MKRIALFMGLLIFMAGCSDSVISTARPVIVESIGIAETPEKTVYIITKDDNNKNTRTFFYEQKPSEKLTGFIKSIQPGEKIHIRIMYTKRGTLRNMIIREIIMLPSGAIYEH